MTMTYLCENTLLYYSVILMEEIDTGDFIRTNGIFWIPDGDIFSNVLEFYK